MRLMRLVSTLCTFPLCQAIFHQYQLMVSMHLCSFAMPVVVQIIVTFYHTTGPGRTDFCHRVTKLIVCPTHLRNSMADTLIYLRNTKKSVKCLLIVPVKMIPFFFSFRICQSRIDKIS